MIFMAEHRCSDCGGKIEERWKMCPLCGSELHKAGFEEQKTHIYSDFSTEEAKTRMYTEEKNSREHETRIYKNQNKKSKSNPIILACFAFILILSLFLIKIPYSVEESYSEMEPYEVQERYTENVPIVDETCSTRDFKYSENQDTIHTASGGYFKTTGSINNKENKGGYFKVQVFYFNSLYHPYANRAYISNSEADLKSDLKEIFVAAYSTEYYTITKYSNATGQWWTRTNVSPPTLNDCVQKTTYEEEEKYRTVTKYRNVQKTRTIRNYKTIFEILTSNK